MNLEEFSKIVETNPLFAGLAVDQIRASEEPD